MERKKNTGCCTKHRELKNAVIHAVNMKNEMKHLIALSEKTKEVGVSVSEINDLKKRCQKSYAEAMATLERMVRE